MIHLSVTRVDDSGGRGLDPVDIAATRPRSQPHAWAAIVWLSVRLGRAGCDGAITRQIGAK